MPYWRGRSILHLAVRWVMLTAAIQFAFYAHPLFANPYGADVVGGSVQMQNIGNTLTIQQATDRAVINWQGFSIGSSEATHFVQPSTSSAVLNRVTSRESSQIMGSLQANGQVYLINPNGIMFGNGAIVNVGSFIATTANVGTDSFMKGGAMDFVGAGEAGIVNQGTIRANSGNVILMAKTVKNEGVIQSPGGVVGLLAGKDFYLKKDEPGSVGVRIGAMGLGVENGVENSGMIEAMKAQLEAQGNVYGLAINQSGIIRATGASRDANGTIVLSAPGGMIRNTGTMLALNRDGSGGRLTISGNDIFLSDLSILTAAGSGESAVAQGGMMEISAERDAILNGRLDVTAGSKAKGGRLVVTGERVGVVAGTLDASGGTGGGEILLGGDYQGMNPLVRNAVRTFVSKDSDLVADATESGDGGRIIVWADDLTKFYGGAQVNGYLDGGFIEISGKEILDFSGTVSAKGLTGNLGLVLFDPTTLAIVGGSGVTGGVTGNAVPPADITDSTLFSDSGLFGTLGATTLNTALENANVTVQASDGMEVRSSASVIVPSGAILTLTGVTLAIDGGISGAGTLDLAFSGSVTQTASVSTSNLVLRSATVTLDTVLNGVSNLAATTGTISFANSGGINISSLAYKGGTANGIESATSVTLLAGGDITQSAPIGDSSAAVPKFVGTLRAGTFGGGNIFLDNIINDVDNLSLRTEAGTPLAPTGTLTSSFIRFSDVDGLVIQNWTVGGVSGGILTAKGGTTLLPTGGSVVLGAGQGPDNDPLVTQAAGARINASNLGLLGKADYTLTQTSNDIYTIAANLTNAGDLSYTDANGFQVFYVDFDPDNTAHDVFIPGIRLAGRGTDPYTGGNLELRTISGTEYDGIQLSATGFVSVPPPTPGGIPSVTVAKTLKASNQYNLLSGFSSDTAPGHVEASGDVLIYVENTGNTDFSNRFTLQEGIHLFAGMNPGLTGFGNGGTVSIQADNMLVGQNSQPALSQHGLIMTGSVNNASTVPFDTGVFLSPFTAQRQTYLISPKADYSVTPDPGQLQLSLGELQRINANRLNVSSAYTDAVNPAVEVRTEMSLYGLYDTTTVSGIFPNNPGVNQIELMATGGDAGAGARGDVTISAPVNSSANNLPMGIFLSASRNDDFFSIDPTVLANNQTSGGTVNVNAGLTSSGGQIGLQGQNVNIGATINANNPALTTQPQNGLVAIFPGRGPNLANSTAPAVPPLVTPILLGTKGGANELGILSGELALISAGTVQIGNMEVRPTVLRPINPYTRTSITGIDPLWYGAIQVADAGPITVTDLIAGLSFNTLALVTSGDSLNPLNNALSQNAQAGIQVDGLFVVGNPSVNTQDYILGGAFNEINRLAVALSDTDAAGAPTGDLLLVNQGGILGGNGGEVAKLGTRWDQGYTRTTTTPVINTGIGLVTARALSIDAKGQVAIYETVPAGATFEGTAVTGLGYIGHVASGQAYPATGSGSYNVGNEIGLLGDNTSGLAVRTTQNLPGNNTVNAVWVAAARGLSVNDLSGEYIGATGLAGILTNGGDVTLEGNAIEIASIVSAGTGRTGGNTITIDTTGASGTTIATQIAPAGARVIIRPATGENGFLDQLGSGAFDPDLENSPLAGAPVEMNLGTTSIGAGTTFLNASLGTVFIGSAALAGTAIRASTLEIGRQTPTGTASGKTTVTADIGGVGSLLSTLLQELRLNSKGAVEDRNLITGATPFTITMNLNNTVGAGGLAVNSLGAVALQADVDELAVSAGTTSNIRFINPTGDLLIGSVDGLSGLRGNMINLASTAGGISQSPGNLVTASAGISLQALGPIRLDQANTFNLVAANAGANSVYLRSSGAMSIVSFGAGQPGNQPAAVSGLTGSSISLVGGGNLIQSDLATINASTSFLAVVPTGFDVSLSGSGNIYGASGTPIIGAYSGTFGTTGTLGSISDLTVYAGQNLTLGSGGLLLTNLGSSAPDWTAKPTVTVGSPSVGGILATVQAIMGVLTTGTRVTPLSSGTGYQSAPLVTLTDTGGTGFGAQGLAVLYNVQATSPNYGKVEYLQITDPGSGYTGPVTVTLDGGGSVSSASFANTKLSLQQLNIVNPGSGYTTTPTITISGVGSSATATALLAGSAGFFNGTAVSGGLTGNLVASTASLALGQILVPVGSAIGVAGTTTLTARGAMTLASTDNALTGTITVGSGGAVTINNSLTSLLGDFTGVTVGGVADLTSPLTGPLVIGSKGDIYQRSASSVMNVAGNASFFATTTALSTGTANGVINMGNANNQFGSAVAAIGTSVTIRENGAILLGNILASSPNTLTISAIGNITQDVGATINSVGVSSFLATGGNITLDNIGNDFEAAVNLATSGGGSASVTDENGLTLGTLSTGALTATSTGALNLGTGTVAGALVATSNGGAITQGTGVSDALTVTGISTINAGAGTITLTQANNDFTGPVTLNSTASSPADFAVQIVDLNSLSLGAPTLGANTGLSAVAGLTLTLPAASINTGSGNLTLTSNGGVLATAGNLVTTSGSISLTGSTGITIGNDVTTTASLGNLALTSINNAITQTAGTVSIFGTTTVAAGTGAITLTQTSNDFTGAVNLTGGTTQITDANGLTLGTLSTGSLTAISTGALNLGTGTISGVLSATSNGGAITQATGADDELVVTGTTTINAGSGTITLTQDDNDFQNTVNLNSTASSPAGFAVQIVDLNSLSLGAPTLGANTGLSAVAGLTLTLPAASINTGSGNLTLTSNGGVLATAGNLVTTSGSISLTGSTGITIGNDVTTTASLGNLALTTVNSAVNQTAGTVSIFGTTTVAAGTGAITLNQGSNDFTGAVSLTGGTTLITDANGLTLGTLSTGALTATSTGALNMGSGTVAGALVATSNGGAITQGTGVSDALTVTGISTIDAGAGTITLTQDDNDFQNTVSLNSTASSPAGFAVQIVDLNSLSLGTPTLGANTGLSVIAGQVLTLPGALINTGSGNLTLTSNGGVLATAGNLVTTSGSISLTGSTGITIGNDVTTTASLGNLALTTVNSAVNQTAGTVSIFGTTTVAAGTGAITLTQANNDFTGAVSLTGGTTLITDANGLTLGTLNTGALTAISTGALNLGTGTISGVLSATSNGGAITQGTGVNDALTVTGISTIDAGAGTITLTQANNDFTEAVNLTGGTTQITDASGLTLGTLSTGALTATSTGALNMGSGTVAGALVATSNGGAITQGTGVSDALTVTGISTIDAGAGTITLTQTGNDFQNTVTLNSTASSPAGYAVQIVDANNLSLGYPGSWGVNTGVSAVAGGTLTLPVGDIITGAGNINFASNGGSLATAGNINTTSGSIALTGSTGITIGNNITTTASLGNLALTTVNSAVNQTAGTVSIFGTTTVNTGTGTITLTQTGNDFTGAVNLTGGTTQITDANGLTLGTLSTGALTVIANASLPGTPGTLNLGTGTISGNLQADSNNGAITQSGALSVAGTTTLTAGTGSITLNNSSNTFGDTVSVVSANNVDIQASGILQTGSINASGSITIGGTQGVYLSGDVTSQGSNIVYTSAVQLNGPVVMTSNGGLITFEGTLNGNQNLSMSAGSGAILFEGSVGVITPLAVVTIGSASTVTAMQAFNANSLILQNGAVTSSALFSGLLNLQSLSIGTGNYTVNIAQSPNSIGGETTFNNTGTVTLGSSGAVNFVGGVVATAPSQLILLGNVRAQGTGVINLGTAVQVSGTSVTVGGASTGDITLGSTTLDNGVTLTVGTGISNAITIGSVNGTAGGSASNLAINTTAGATVGDIGTDIGSFTTSAGTLTAQNITSSGAITLTMDNLTLPSQYQIKSTGGGTISFAPTTAGRSIWLGSGGPVTGELNLGSVVSQTVTSGSVVVGKTGLGGSGAITVAGNIDASANGFSSLSLRSQNSDLNFALESGTLVLPSAVAVDFRLGTGNIKGSSSAISISASGGSVQFVSAGGVTLGTAVSQLLESTLSQGLVLINDGSLQVNGTQRVGSSSDLLVETTSGSITLNSGAFFSGRNLTIASAQNFYNYAGSDPFGNSTSGRTLVYSADTQNNYPTSVTAGLSGFSSVFRVSQDFLYGPAGTYTVANADQIPAGDSMVYSGNPVIPDLTSDTGLVNGFVNDASYITSVPIQGYTLPTVYTGAIRMNFDGKYAKDASKANSALSQKSDDLRNLDMQNGNAEPVSKEKSRGLDLAPVPSPGRLKVGELPKQSGEGNSAQSSDRGGGNFRPVEVGKLELRMSGDFLPFELSEVTIRSGKVSKDR